MPYRLFQGNLQNRHKIGTQSFLFFVFLTLIRVGRQTEIHAPELATLVQHVEQWKVDVRQQKVRV